MGYKKYSERADFSIESSVVVGEIYRYKDEWKFNAVGSGFKGGLKTLCLNYGVNLEIQDRNRGVVVLAKGQKISLKKNNDPIIDENGWIAAGKDYDLRALVRYRNGKQTIEIPASDVSANDLSYTLCFGEIMFGQEKDSLEVSALEMYSAPNSENRIGYRNGQVVMDIGPSGAKKS